MKIGEIYRLNQDAQKMLERLFVQEIKTQAEHALIAWNDVQVAKVNRLDENWINRIWRDHFDHFDERLEAWCGNRFGVCSGIQDRAIRSEYDIGMIPPPDQLRRYNPEANRLLIRSKDGSCTENFELEPVIECIRNIKELASSLLDKNMNI
jgi:hypothetical protein